MQRHESASHHKAGLRADAVGDGLYPAVGHHDRVLARDLGRRQCRLVAGGSLAHLVPVTLLLLVEVIPDIVLYGVAVSVRHERPRPAAPDPAWGATTESAPAPTAPAAGSTICAQRALVGLSTKEPY